MSRLPLRGTPTEIPKGMTREEFRAFRKSYFACYCDTCYAEYLAGRLHPGAGVRAGRFPSGKGRGE